MTSRSKQIATSSDRNEPPKVSPLSDGDVTYEAPANLRGTLIAIDKKTGKEIWRVFLTDYIWVPMLESDAQEVFIKSLQFIQEKSEIIVEDEAGTLYSVDIKTRMYKIITWPVQIHLVQKKATPDNWNYRIHLKIVNNRNKAIHLDGVSVAQGGEVLNNLFEVMVDEKLINYIGVMAKRARPTKFIELNPLDEHKSEVELGEHYPIPKGNHKVKIRFKHKNHFSPDQFQMISPWIEVEF